VLNEESLIVELACCEFEIDEDEAEERIISKVDTDEGKIFELLTTMPVEDIEDEIDEPPACELDGYWAKEIELLEATPVELNKDEADIMEMAAWRVDRDEDANCDELSEELTAARPNAYRLRR
jgi:hypothetical protein